MTKILFVCTGNTCRSPMAEAIAKHMKNPAVQVKSAGIFAIPGADFSPFAKEVLKENQIIETHQSQTFNKKDAEWADLILTMTRSHKQILLQNHPEFEKKIYTLKEYVEGSDADILDPFGGTMETYRHTYKELKNLIEKLIEKLT